MSFNHVRYAIGSKPRSAEQKLRGVHTLSFFFCSPELLCGFFDVKDRSYLFSLYSVILEHPRINSNVLAFDFQCRRWGLRVEHKVIVAMGAILVT